MRLSARLHVAAQCALVCIGLLEPLGYLLRQPPWRELGFATMASPLPLVFTDREDMEDFAQQYSIRARTRDGVEQRHALRAGDLQRVEGPFARRAAYAAAIAYGPRLPEGLWRPALEYGFCEGRVLSGAIGARDPLSVVVLELIGRTRGRRPGAWKASIRCDR